MAGMGLKLRHNGPEVIEELEAWGRAVIEVATPRTLNKVAEQAQVAGFRKISQLYRIGPRTMEKYATVRLAKRGDYEASITVKGVGFPIYTFGARQTKKGVSVSVKGRRFVIPGTFIGRMRSGHVGVFARGAYGGKGKIVPSGKTFGRFHFGKRRLSINELFTLSPPDAFRNPEVVDAMNDRAREQIPIVLAQEIRFATR